VTTVTPRPLDLPCPAYGSHSLADLGPAVLAGLGVPGERAGLGLHDLRRVVVLLVDGMGSEQLREHSELAPFLSSLAGAPLTACFPTTTVTSISSWGTGLTPGQHGLPGYTSWLPEADAVVGWLAWSTVGGRDPDGVSVAGRDLRRELPPEDVQPATTIFERAAADGIAVTQCAPAAFLGSGLTRAVLRGAEFPGAVGGGDVLAQAGEAVRRGDRSLVYCYTSELDTVGHVRGPGSEAWCEQLRLVDGLARRLAEVLPPEATLLVTADHGMVRVAEESKVDLDTTPGLLDGVLAVAGEPRVRHLRVRGGADRDVVDTWRGVLGARAWVGTGDDAVGAGLFGPSVTAAARSRIGDVLAIALDDLAVVSATKHPREAALVGHHGALTPAELDIPLLRT
jgi:hypothetical protein